MYENVQEKAICPRCGSMSEAIDKEMYRCTNPACKAEFPSLNIFISYGHPESVICERILDALRKRGHRPWFDTEQIRHGQDWRVRIADGINKSNGVVSCLSKHSVREPGVCLDELSIAIGVRGGNIKTILLEPEQEVRAPASVCHIQWLDMSEWKTYYEKGAADFEPWFNEKMDALFAVIESKESREFTGQITYIREKLRVNDSTAKQRYLLNEFFVGREWLTQMLENWLDDPDGPRLCALYGDPGVGKSAFAAHYIHYNPRVAAWLFCDYDQPYFSDAKTVIMTLAYQLACRLPVYRKRLIGILNTEEQLINQEPQALFNMLLATPLTNYIDGGHETLCIVVDGLDESTPNEKNVLADTLGRMAKLLPRWLRVLVTARETSAVVGPLKSDFHINLRGPEAQNLVDVRAYFTETLGERFSGDPAWPAALDALVERSGGIFLYAKLVSDGIAHGKVSIYDTSRFPDGLSKAFYEWFNWYFPDEEEYKAKFRRLIGVLTAVPEPMPAEELHRIFPQWDRDEINDFIRRFEAFLRRDTNDFGKETIAFSHKYFIEWLDSLDAGRFRASKAAAIETMAKRFYGLFQEDVKGLTTFESLHLAGFLRQSGREYKKALHEVTLSHDLLWKIMDAGKYCETWGKLSQAQDHYAQTLIMAEIMVRECSGEDENRNLSVCYNLVAGIRESLGDLKSALMLYKKSFTIREQLVRTNSTPENRRNLSINYERIANILKTEGNIDEALNQYEEGLAINKRLVEERDTTENNRELSVSYEKVADILKDKGKLDAALTLYQKMLAISEKLAHSCNSSEKYRDLCISYEKVADLFKAKGNIKDALLLYKKEVRIFEQLLHKDGTLEAYRDLSIGYVKVADILKLQDDLDGALVLYKKDLAIRKMLVQKRSIPEDRRDLGISYNRVADILKAKEKLDDALMLYKKELAIFEQLSQSRNMPDDWRGVSISTERIADILKLLRDFDGALTLYKKELSISEQLVQKRGSADDYNDMSVAYEKIGDTLKAKDDLCGAMIQYKKGIAICEQLAQERGAINDYNELAILLYKAACLPGEQSTRVNYVQRALSIAERLYQTTQSDRHQAFCRVFQKLLERMKD